MTDPHDLDELASALLDGATTPDDTARLAADPALRARVEARADELGAVRRALAEPPAVDPVRRDRAIAAALDAFDDRKPAGATVTPLAPRRGLSPRAVRALSAAAVILILALLVPLLTRMEDDDESASFESTGSAISGPAAESGGSDGGDAEDQAVSAPQASTTTEVLVPRVAGSYDDFGELAAAVASALEARENASSTFDGQGEGDAPLCEPGSSGLPAFTAEVDGVSVEVYVRTADGTRTMTVRDRGSCELLDVREL